MNKKTNHWKISPNFTFGLWAKATGAFIGIIWWQLVLYSLPGDFAWLILSLIAGLITGWLKPAHFWMWPIDIFLGFLVAFIYAIYVSNTINSLPQFENQGGLAYLIYFPLSFLLALMGAGVGVILKHAQRLSKTF